MPLGCFGSGTKFDMKVGAALRCRHAITLLLLVQAGVEAVGRDGVVEVVLDVVLARPHHLHRRTVHRLGQKRGLDREVALRLSAEAAAKQRLVHDRLLWLDAERFGDVVARAARALQRRPDLPFAAALAGRGGRRLHRRMREMRRVVVRRDDLFGGLQRLINVAYVALHLARLAHVGFQLGLVGRGIVGLVRSVVPNDLERFAALHRRPSVLGDHGDAAERGVFRRRRRRRDGDHLLDAGHLHGGAGIIGLDLAADDRRPCDDRELHPRQFHVLP